MTTLKVGDRVAVADYLAEHLTWFSAGTLVALETKTDGPIVDVDYSYLDDMATTPIERVAFEKDVKLVPEAEAPGKTVVLYHRPVGDGEDEIYLTRRAGGEIELWVNACIVYDSQD